MGKILKIAWRNILAHKAKTLIIGILVLVSSFLFVLANSFLSSAQRGMANTYQNSLTGELAVFKNITFDYSMFGTWGDMGNIIMPDIPDYDQVLSTVQEHPGVEEVLPLSTSFALLLDQGEETSEWMVPFGIDPQSYQQMFDVEQTITLIQGSFLQEGEPGLLLPQYIQRKYEENQEIRLDVGDEVMFMAWGGTSGGPKIRTVPIVGIFEFTHVKLGSMMEDNMPMLSRTALMDRETFQGAFGTPVSARVSALEPSETSLFVDTGDMESLFSDTIEVEIGSSPEMDIDSLFGAVEYQEEAEVAAREWKWLLIRTKDRSETGIRQVQSELDQIFQDDFSQFEPGDLTNPVTLAQIIGSESSRLSLLLVQSLTSQEKDALLDIQFMESSQAAAAMSGLLNSLLDSTDGWVDQVQITDQYFSRVTRDLIKAGPNSTDQRRLARLILEESYPDYIAKGPDIQINEWWQAGAPMSFITMGIAGVFNGGMLIVFIIIAIVLANTMMISVMERTSEIGTIRALGGRKSFLARLFLSESFLTINAFTLLGALLAGLLMASFGSQGIYIPDDSFLVMMLGSNTYYPLLDWGAVIGVLILMNAVGFLASLVPVFFATRVSPLKAMQDE
jgi:ABC-type lipoprotein release transport system permease subunit